MKTRKVGKIVSLLVAIVLVATIMIPAASVLADSSEYAGVTWTEVGDFASLKQAFDNANKTGEKTYIRLTSDITLQRPYFSNDEITGGGTNWDKMYLYSTTRITEIEEKLSGNWASGKRQPMISHGLCRRRTPRLTSAITMHTFTAIRRTN